MIKILKNLHKKEMLFIIISIFFIIIQVWLDLKIPEYMSNITRLIQLNSANMNDILNQGLWMLLCSLGSLLLAIFVGYFAAYVGTSFEKKLRRNMFEKVGTFNMEEIQKFSTSSLITRTTNDITQVKMFLIMGIQMLAKAPIMAFMAIMKIMGKEWTFSLITIIGVVIILLLVTVLIFVVIPKFKKVQKLTDDINKITRENLTGIRVVRAYNAEDYQLNKFENVNDDLTKTHMFTQRLMAIVSPVMTSVMSLLSLAIYWTGAYIINKSLLANKIVVFSDMVVFSSYAVQIIISFMLLAALFIIYPRASVSISRINEVLSTNSKIKDGNISKDNGLKGEVVFNNVSFKYPEAEEYVLKNISFKASNGEVIGVIGSTGSGKSTLVNLIPRFYDATEGEILVDGINIKDMKLEYLYNKLGYISQKPILFKGTVKNNISLGKVNGKKVDINNIEKSLEVAQAEEFVSKMDKGINSNISQSGTNISGGQKQRLSIARAISRNPEIYIFDDSFSALDFKTDYNLRKQLNKYTKNSTKFIVSNRIGTIKDADKILVLDNGILVGNGTHKELLNNCKVYREIAESQISKEELENA